MGQKCYPGEEASGATVTKKNKKKSLNIYGRKNFASYSFD